MPVDDVCSQLLSACIKSPPVAFNDQASLVMRSASDQACGTCSAICDEESRRKCAEELLSRSGGKQDDSSMLAPSTAGLVGLDKLFEPGF